MPRRQKNRATPVRGLTMGDAKPDEEGTYQDIMQNLEWTRSLQGSWNVRTWQGERSSCSPSAGSILIVLTPGVTTFDTPEEPDLAFIRRPQLAQPPEGEIMLALRAPDRDGGQRPD